MDIQNLLHFGIEDEYWAKIIPIISSIPEVEALVLFGSRAKGNFKPASDIDLAIFGDIPDRSRTKIWNKLDDLYIIWTIDTVYMHDLKHEGLRRHIQVVGKVLYQNPLAAPFENIEDLPI
ncbi:MAG: nucleotidyltransferase domain-containing protein [Bacteroidota bacterium]